MALELAPALFSRQHGEQNRELIRRYYEAVLGLGISFNQTESTLLWPRLLLEQPQRYKETHHWRELHSQFAPILLRFRDLMRQWAQGDLSGEAILAALEQSADDAGDYLAYFTDLAAPLLDGDTLKQYWLEAQLTALAALANDAKLLGLGLLVQDLSHSDAVALLAALPEDLKRQWIASGKDQVKANLRALQALAKVEGTNA